jgi:glycosyltransferase involved in cell wall biosynthesis
LTGGAAANPPVSGLTVVIPARDEERGLAATLAALRAVEPHLGRPLEIVVVDDGSRDATARVAAEAGARICSHPESAGYGRALKTGIAAASHELIAIMDADGTYPVEELPALLELAKRFDMVVGARTGPHFRRVRLSPTQATFLLLTNFVTGRWLRDPNSGFRVFRRADVLPLLDRLPNGFSFTTTLSLVLTLNGAFVHFHPIEYRPRIGSSKVRFILDALRAGQGMLEVVLRYNPLKAFLAFAFVPLVLAFIVALLPLSSGVKLLALLTALATGCLIFAVGMAATAISGARRGK